MLFYQVRLSLVLRLGVLREVVASERQGALSRKSS